MAQCEWKVRLITPLTVHGQNTSKSSISEKCYKAISKVSKVHFSEQP